MTKEQYNEWRNHPATLFFRQFLKDRAQHLIQDSNETWLNAPEIFEKQSPEARGRIRELLEVQDVAFEVIQAFYRERNHATEGIEAVPS